VEGPEKVTGQAGYAGGVVLAGAAPLRLGGPTGL
jgi:hypothetical protein